MNKILFHLCCGPCGTASIVQLRRDGFEPTVYYYNPNIHPRVEYKKRLSEVKKLAGAEKFELIEDIYNPDDYHEAVRGAEDDKKERCARCWALRLKKTAAKAKESGFADFGTSLRVSPYQDQPTLLAIATEIAAENGLNFYDFPLENLYRESVSRSRELEMYRQKYCGCEYSKDHR